MALANYTDLLASAALWLNRSDLTSVIPDFVLLAEEDFNAQLRNPQQETEASLSCSTQYTALPSDFLQVRRAHLLVGSLWQELKATSANVMGPTSAGEPAYYALTTNQLELVPTPSTTYTVKLDYYAKIPALVSNATNWLLTLHPSVYLFGTCLQAGYYLDDDRLVQKFAPKYSQQLLMVRSAGRLRKQGHALQVVAN